MSVMAMRGWVRSVASARLGAAGSARGSGPRVSPDVEPASGWLNIARMAAYSGADNVKALTSSPRTPKESLHSASTVKRQRAAAVSPTVITPMPWVRPAARTDSRATSSPDGGSGSTSRSGAHSAWVRAACRPRSAASKVLFTSFP